MKNIAISIPKEVRMVIATLQSGGYEAYLVGGCVRDLLMNKDPQDYDVTTNATPDQIIALFPKTFYENIYGTVGVVTCGEELGTICSNENIKIVEVTPYRLESEYSDNRHPDKILWSENIEDDLKRRDFTVNAIAYDPVNNVVKDLFKGQEDIKDMVIRAVGDPDERFQEDALRLMRAIRFMSQLDFEIDTVTRESIRHNAHRLANVSHERIRDELVKLVMTDYPMRGIIMLYELDLLKYIVPQINIGHYTCVWQRSFMMFLNQKHVDFHAKRKIIRFMDMMLLAGALHVK
jgi:tRNA nucleotidyltransferase/poly(A) polymerase